MQEKKGVTAHGVKSNQDGKVRSMSGREMSLIFTGFLLVAAWQDFRSRKIQVWLYLCFGAAGLLAAVMGGEGGVLTPGRGWLGIAAAVLPGLCLLLLSHLSRGGIGSGDAWFFMVAALYLELWEMLALLFYGLLFCSTCSLGIVTWGMASGVNVRKKRLPFLPFLIPAWIWLKFM